MFELIVCHHQEKEDQQKEEKFSPAQFDCSQFYDYQAATTSTEKALCRGKHAGSFQNVSHVAWSLCPSQGSSRCSRCQDANIASTQPSMILEQEHCDADAAERGKALNLTFIFFLALF